MIWGSLLWYFVLDSFYNYIIGGPYVGALAKAITGSTFWLTTILTVFILMVPVLAWRFYTFDCNPSLADKIRMKQRETKLSRSRPEMLRTPSARRSRRSLRSSYAFAHEVKRQSVGSPYIFSWLSILGRIWSTHHVRKDHAETSSRFCFSIRTRHQETTSAGSPNHKWVEGQQQDPARWLEQRVELKSTTIGSRYN